MIIDHATGLMWQKSESQESMTHAGAQAYANSLNDAKFAEYDNWRLPTVEELLSLMELEATWGGGWYIDPLFDYMQLWVWSADTYQIKDESSLGLAWVVDVDRDVGGYYVYLHLVSLDGYVRCVRFGQ